MFTVCAKFIISGLAQSDFGGKCLENRRCWQKLVDFRGHERSTYVRDDDQNFGAVCDVLYSNVAT